MNNDKTTYQVTFVKSGRVYKAINVYADSANEALELAKKKLFIFQRQIELENITYKISAK